MSLLLTSVPVVALAVAGYVVAKLNVLKPVYSSAISNFAFSIAIPALLFLSAAKAELPETVNWTFLASFYAPVVLVFGIALQYSKAVLKHDSATQSVFSVCAAYSNTTMLGIPLCVQLLGESALVPLLLIIYIQNMFIYALGTLAAERDHFSLNAVFSCIATLLLQLIKNPILVSIALGFLVNTLGIALWHGVSGMVSIVATCAVPTALFVMGMSLSSFRLGRDAHLTIVPIFLKNLVLPAVVYVTAFHIFQLETLWAATATLAASMPIGVSAYVFAQRSHVWVQETASCVLLSSVFSVLSITAFMLLMSL